MNITKKILTKFQNTLIFFLSLITYVSIMGIFFWIFSYAYPEIIQATREAAVTSITFVITFLFMLNAYGGLDVGEKRTGLENKLAAAVDFLQHRVAGDVAGQQVGGELDAFGAEF